MFTYFTRPVTFGTPDSLSLEYTFFVYLIQHLLVLLQVLLNLVSHVEVKEIITFGVKL